MVQSPAPQTNRDRHSGQIHSLGDLPLFLLNLADGAYPCSQYMPKVTKEVLSQVANSQITPEQALIELVMTKPLQTNNNFTQFYREMASSDLVLELNQEKFRCHQFVFHARSAYLKNTLMRTKQQTGQTAAEIVVPGWIDRVALHQFIRFNYTNDIKLENRHESNGRANQCLSLFKCAGFFYDNSLQEYLVASEIIPNMTIYAAVLFMRVIREDNFVRRPQAKVSCFLYDYCQFYLSKHLPTAIKKEKATVLTLEADELYKVINQSMEFLVFDNADLDAIIEFAAELWAQGDIIKLLNLLQDRTKTCSSFDEQHIPQMRQLREYKVPQDLCMDLQQGFGFDKLHKRDKENHSLEVSEQIEEVVHMTQSFGLQGPSQNVLALNEASQESKAAPAYRCEFDLTEQNIQERLRKGGSGVTLFSKPFDSQRRSWHVKVDIQSQPESLISLWLVEGGSMQDEEVTAVSLYKSAVITKYSSVLCEMAIEDLAMHNRKAVFFFSFSHDKHQIIGYKNFVSLDQLQNKQNLKISVTLTEFTLHSATMDMLASSFQRRFKEEIASKEMQILTRGQSRQNLGVLSLTDIQLYQLLCSDHLKVDDEHIVLQFIYKYVKDSAGNGSLAQSIATANLLTKTLRFNYIDIYNIMSAVRKNSILQQSPVFQHSFDSEYHARLSMEPGEEINPEYCHFFCDRPRKHYNSGKAQRHGRGRILMSGKPAHLVLSEEMLQWTFDSKIPEQTKAQMQQQCAQQTHRETVLIQPQIKTTHESVLAQKPSQILQDYEQAISSMKTANFRVGGIITPGDSQMKVAQETPLKDKENCEPPSLSDIKPCSDLMDDSGFISAPQVQPASQTKQLEPPKRELPDIAASKQTKSEPFRPNQQHNAPVEKSQPPQTAVKRELPSFLKKPESKKEEAKETAKAIESKQAAQVKGPSDTVISGKSSHKSMSLSMIMDQLKEKDAPNKAKQLYLGGGKGGQSAGASDKGNCLLF